MRICLATTLFPNREQPTRSLYNLRLVQALRRLGHEVCVLAPIPWCPGIDPVLRRRRLPPLEEVVDGTRVLHPRFFYTPGVFISKHYLMYRYGVAPVLKEVIAEYEPGHVILGFVYPDAAAMAPVCREQGLEYSVLVLGSDFRIRVRHPGFRRIVLKTLGQAPLVLCPGEALKRAMAEAGIEARKIVAFRNGVDHSVFQPLSVALRPTSPSP